MGWKLLVGVLLLLPFSVSAEKRVAITEQLHEIEVWHGDRWIKVERNQDTEHRVAEAYARTSRPCPPFCIQPMQVAPGVETYGELELLQLMQELRSGAAVLVDARTPDWYAGGTLPGAINIPYTDLEASLGAEKFAIEFSLERLGVRKIDGAWDFFQAKRALFWCNGAWCDQSPTAIRALISLGYPAEKLKYYRGGMQMWQLMGFPVVEPLE